MITKCFLSMAPVVYWATGAGHTRREVVDEAIEGIECARGEHVVNSTTRAGVRVCCQGRSESGGSVHRLIFRRSVVIKLHSTSEYYAL